MNDMHVQEQRKHVPANYLGFDRTALIFVKLNEPCHEKRVLMQPCAHLRKTRLKSGHASCIIFHVVQTFAAPAPPPVCRTHKAMRRRDGTCHYLLAALYLKEIRQETAKLQIFLRRASGNCQL